jgi:hypothetical protein
MAEHKGRHRGDASRPASTGRRCWSQRVTSTSNALDLEPGVFKRNDPKEIADSLKRSALASHRRKTEPYRSALSMLVFYLNRAGRNLPAKRKRILEVLLLSTRAMNGNCRGHGADEQFSAWLP